MAANGDDTARRDRLLAAAQSLGVALDERQADTLLAFLALLQRWNRVYNLTALRDGDRMLSHHLIDCLALLPALRRHVREAAVPALSAPRVLDVGSGGGLPGVVLACLEPSWALHCVDAVAKKTGFIRQAAAELGLRNLTAHHARVEALPAATGRFDLITSRAFASLGEFTRLSAPLLADHGVWVAMKARIQQSEVDELPASVNMFHVEQLQVPGLDATRCLVWMRPQAC